MRGEKYGAVPVIPERLFAAQIHNEKE
jgi:hypothetical protein